LRNFAPPGFGPGETKSPGGRPPGFLFWGCGVLYPAAIPLKGFQISDHTFHSMRKRKRKKIAILRGRLNTAPGDA
jgi:hypothetical protein